MKQNKSRRKKSIIYEIVIGILTFIFVGTLFTSIILLTIDDSIRIRTEEDFYYQILTSEYYSPFAIYDDAQFNRVNGVYDGEDYEEIYAYSDYYMDSLRYYGTKNEKKKELYKTAMKEDLGKMGKLEGLSDRIDRYFKDYDK